MSQLSPPKTLSHWVKSQLSPQKTLSHWVKSQLSPQKTLSHSVKSQLSPQKTLSHWVKSQLSPQKTLSHWVKSHLAKLLKGGTKLLKGGTKSLGWATGGVVRPPRPPPPPGYGPGLPNASWSSWECTITVTYSFLLSSIHWSQLCHTQRNKNCSLKLIVLWPDNCSSFIIRNMTEIWY